MTIKSKIQVLAFVAIPAMVFSFGSEAQQTPTTEQTNSISLSPRQCVAINRGNTCYIDINLSWTAIEEGEYCLYSSQQKAPMQCWQNEVGGAFIGEIALQNNVTFSIVAKQTDKVLGSVVLEVVWIYKKKQRIRSTWRMF